MGIPFDRRVIDAIESHPAVRCVRLVGSRASGTASAISDWDFAIETDDFESVARDIQSLLAEFEPLAQQWDRLGETQCWMVMLRGPLKLDLIFAEPHQREPPWRPEPSNLVAIDAHFWDWAVWLLAKRLNHRIELVETELRKMFDHILHPMGVQLPPASLDTALTRYLGARVRLEHDFAVTVPRALELEAVRALREYSGSPASVTVQYGRVTGWSARDRTRLLFHIAFESDWNAAVESGTYRVSTRGARLDEIGFIHAGFAHQVAGVGALHYRDSPEPLVVLAIDTQRLDVPVVVENLEGGDEGFPHIYGALPTRAVVDVRRASVTADGRFVVEESDPT